MSLTKNKRKIFPKFAYIPVSLVIVFNCLAFWGTKAVTANADHFNFSTPIDSLLPFVPFFTFFYILAYAQWVWNYVYHTRLGKDKYYNIITADLIAKILSTACFLIIPAQISRPEIVGDGFWAQATKLIYSLDSPTALFPSIHCVESWLCFRASCMLKDAPRWYAPFQFVLTILVFASTVLIKQHFIVDVLAGVVVVEIGLILSGRFGLWRLLNKVDLSAVKFRSNNED